MAVKKSKEEKEEEFIDAVEQILGFPVLPWQKRMLLDVRQSITTGKSIRLSRQEILKQRKF